jgi:molybdopterin biosynthesis enzyme MoaB
MIISDSAAQDNSLDKSGPTLRLLLEVPLSRYHKEVASLIVPDDKGQRSITTTVKFWVLNRADCIIAYGGTGFGKQDGPTRRALSRPY